MVVTTRKNLGRVLVADDDPVLCALCQATLWAEGWEVELAADGGVELELFKGLPLGSGLGSSGASACAALSCSTAPTTFRRRQAFATPRVKPSCSTAPP